MVLVEGRIAMTVVRTEKNDAYLATFKDSVPVVLQWHIRILKDWRRMGAHPVAHTEWLNQRKLCKSENTLNAM